MTGLPVSPADRVPPGITRAVSVAHGAQSVLSQLAHASRHAGAAAAAAGHPEAVTFNLQHCANHTERGIAEQNSSIACLVQFSPQAGAELGRLRDTTTRSWCPVPGCEVRDGGGDWEYAPPGPARGRTPAHLAQTVLVALTHCRAHVRAAQEAPDAENFAFEVQHLRNHVDEAYSHHRKYIGALTEFYPPVAAELAALGKLADLDSAVQTPARSAPLDGHLALSAVTAGGPRSDDEQDELTATATRAQRAHDELAARFLAGSVNGDLTL